MKIAACKEEYNEERAAQQSGEFCHRGPLISLGGSGCQHCLRCR